MLRTAIFVWLQKKVAPENSKNSSRIFGPSSVDGRVRKHVVMAAQRTLKADGPGSSPWEEVGTQSERLGISQQIQQFKLGGGFKYVLLSSLFGEDFQFD